jgi:hypothetical protein
VEQEPVQRTYIGSVLISDRDNIGFGPPRTYSVKVGYKF